MHGARPTWRAEPPARNRQARHQQSLRRKNQTAIWENDVHVSPVPLMIHSVEATLSAVAMPFAASVRVPVVPAPASLMVSVVIAILRAPAPLPFLKVTAVPTA